MVGSCPGPQWRAVSWGWDTGSIHRRTGLRHRQVGFLRRAGDLLRNGLLLPRGSQSDYQAHLGDGYTVGRVAITNTGSGSQRNLEVDVGEVTSESYNMQTQFDFNF